MLVCNTKYKRSSLLLESRLVKLSLGGRDVTPDRAQIAITEHGQVSDTI